MERIASFQVDHNKLEPGLYLSRRDGEATTLDLRFKKPNTGDLLSNAEMHSVEHVIATLLRSGRAKDAIIYFGPMGCQTGFYLLFDSRQLTDGQAVELVKETFAAGAPFFRRLASASEVHVTAEAPAAQGMVEVITHAARVLMPLAELVDVQQELERIAKEKAKAEGHLKSIEAKLNNEAFISKAPANIVQNQRDQAEKLRALIAQLERSEKEMRQ